MTRKYGDIGIKNKTLVNVCIKGITAFMSFLNKTYDKIFPKQVPNYALQ